MNARISTHTFTVKKSQASKEGRKETTKEARMEENPYKNMYTYKGKLANRHTEDKQTLMD